MKKTSLLLAIGALLYGTASVYALPKITPDMSDADILEIVNQVLSEIPSSDIPEEPENAPALPPNAEPPDGLDPAQALPLNVGLDNTDILYRPKMCPDTNSFQVNGNTMPEFPVEVTPQGGTPELGVWNGNVVLGTDWMLILPSNDTWNTGPLSQWILHADVPIEKVLLKPIERNTMLDPVGHKTVYTFDVGGKQRGSFNEHTKGAARGRFIKQTTPTAPPPIFTAIYSNPVFITAGGGLHFNNDTNAIGINNPQNPADRVPSHDLYGTLEINFDPAVGDILIDPDFAFLADTDCILSVEEAIYSGDQLTLRGNGLVYVMETNAAGGEPSFIYTLAVDRDELTVGVSDNVRAGYCYSLVKEDLTTILPINIDGVEKLKDEICF
ncbi:MAG: hypothetical protein HC877_18070 [Thioploca sp.]|nr:hypothetical protein [Thioploca sp.]